MPPPIQRSVNVAEHFARATELNQRGDLREAERHCVEILQVAPRHFGALSLLGTIMLRTRRPKRAVELFNRALELNPVTAVLYTHLGEAFGELNEHEKALDCYNKAISLKPKVAAGYNNRGIALHKLQRFEEAIKNFDRAIELQPDFARAYVNRGNALRALEQPQAALEHYEKAIALAPNLVTANLNRGAILHDLLRFDEAVESCDKTIALRPNYAEAFYNRGNALRGLGRLEEAITSYDRALELKPKYAQAHWNKANCILLLGDLENGLREYEYRVNRSLIDRRSRFSQAPWLGEEDIEGKTLFIYPELYLGDMIQFCRFAKRAEACGAKVILAAQPSLHRLLRPLSPTIEFIDQDAIPEHYDYHCPLMSLPLAFKTTLDSIYAPVPYLSAEPDRVEMWQRKLGQQGMKIGICWQGSTTSDAIRTDRSFPLALFRNISQLADVRLISLQKGEGTAQLSDLPDNMKVEALGDEFDGGPDAFVDTAAVVESLDLVITTDTAVAHVAGALGRPTWVVLKNVPDWRWLLDRSDSPWYPTMRLFRRKHGNDWQAAFAEAEAALESQIGTKA